MHNGLKDKKTNTITLQLLLQDAKCLWEQQDHQEMMSNFKSMLDATDDYIYLKDCNHVFICASKNLVGITVPSEYSPCLTGKTDYDVLPEAYADACYSLEKQVFSGMEVAHKVQETLDNQGKKIWIDNRQYPIKNDDGEIIGLFGIARDITQSKLIENELEYSKTKFNSLFNAMGDALLMLDEMGLQDCNQSALDLFGFGSQQDIRQYHLAELSPASQACGTDSRALENHYINASKEQGSVRFEWIFQRADTGKKIIADMLLTSLELDEKVVLRASIRDITRSKQIERREQARNAVLEALTQQQSLTKILEILVQSIEQELPSSLCSILLLDDEGKRLTIGSAPNLPDFYNQAIHGIEVGIGAGSCGTAAFLKKRIIVEDIQTHPYWTPYKELAAKAQLGACWSEPIIGSNGDVLGTFAIYHQEKNSPDKDDSHVISFASQLSTIVIERHRYSRKQRLFSRVFNNAREGIIITNAQQLVVDVNPAFTDITGYCRNDILGQNPNILSSGNQRPEFYQDMWLEINEKGYWQGEVSNRNKNGQIYVEFLSISALKNEQDEITHYVGIFSDITHFKQQQEKLSQMAHYDMLTGLPNRVLFADRFHQAIAHSKRTGYQLAVCFLDLDNFKAVNDRYGHSVGDRLLVEVSERISVSIREEDTVSRQGGDEFTLLLNDLESDSQCQITIERILNALAKPYVIDSIPHKITASIGITLYPNDDADIDTLIRNADNAMYQAKLSGKNRYHIFDSLHSKELKQKHLKLFTIQKALINKELILYYQPKVNMRSGKVFGVEALLRWQHPELGIVSPLEFLPLIDGTDLELKVGDWVINQALQQMEYWFAQGVKLEVSVNVSCHHLQSDAFIKNLKAALMRYPSVEANCLQLEILESSALSDIRSISQIVESCKEELGVNFALDDFGTGYSSLTHLRNLTAEIIKIDQSFVRDVLDDAGDYSIIDGVLGLAESFGCGVIAEGVETTEHGLMFQIMGGDKVQGYVVAKPMPADEFVAWLTDYQPNQQWLDFGKKDRTVKEKKLMLFRLVSSQWMKSFTSNVQSSKENILSWPIIEDNQAPCCQWVRRKHKLQLFPRESLDKVDEAHECFHSVAREIYNQYQDGNLIAAREALPELRLAFNRMNEEVGCLE